MVPSILGMAGALAARGDRVRIVTPTPSRLGGTMLPSGVRLDGPEADLEAAVRRADAVQIHGLWQGHGRRGASEARRSRVPYLIASHGMADPWALRHKAIRKRVYSALVEGKNLRRAACLHALSAPEVSHLRQLAPRSPVALIPNGVDLRPFDDLPRRAELDRAYPELVGKFVLLFFGRLHAKKGLDLLARGMAAVVGDHPRLHLLLAGRDDGALAPFLAESSSLGLAGRITVTGHLAGGSARIAWGGADAFVLPSYSEGFSMAVLESLAARKPSIVTTSCHFPELIREEAGIVVGPTEVGVTAGLRDLLDRSESQRAELGARGRELVERRYTWDRQAERLAAVYRWVAGGGGTPEAVTMAGDS